MRREGIRLSATTIQVVSELDEISVDMGVAVKAVEREKILCLANGEKKRQRPVG